MPKRLLEDIVRKPATKEIKKNPKVEEVREVREIGEIAIKTETTQTKNRSRFLLWFVALISVVFCFFAVSFLFAKAKVSITPKTQEVTVNENLSASKDSSSGGLIFNLVVIPGQENKKIQATGEKEVQEVATGTMVIYNAFSSAPQTLNINTKLEGSNGKIYKTDTKTVVPGMGKDGTPGQVEVNIDGNAPGADYNSDPLDFKIVNFKGTPKYAKIYGRSKGSITGGFIGQAPDVSLADKLVAESNLKNALQAELLQKATDQIPAGFILYKDAIFLDTGDSDLSTVYNQDNSMTLTQSGTLYGILLNEQGLTKKIAENNIDKYDGSDIYIPNIKNLVFSLSNQGAISFADMQSINFNLSGPAQIVWKVDVNKFTSDLLGKPKNDFTQILSQYLNISSATLTVSPIWKMSVPDKVKDVTVTVNYPQ